ncbi:hypothetical protein K501DRAFT_267943 [Backusella circina FSU 941]|nr:hypothetical protein K501DRAFT_267943 [Backusella circina FSU 941]
MIHQLPLEVALDIVKFLSHSELLRCSETCCDWNNLIKNKVMIQSLELKSTKALNSAMIAAYRGHINGGCMKSLTTTCKSTDCHYAVETIPRIFPAMKTFKFGNLSFTDDDNLIQFRKIVAYKKWQSCLETLHITGVPREIGLLLRKCLFRNLIDLSLGLEGIQNLFHDSQSIITNLQHVPTLKSLTLRGGYYLFFTMEKLHKSVPSLNILNIHFAAIAVNSRDLLNNITPANSTTHLSFIFGMDQRPQRYTSFLQYIAYKYKSLSHLALQLHIENSIRSLPRFGNEDAELISLIPQLPPTLESFINRLIYTKKTLINALDNAVTSGVLPKLTEFYIWVPDSSLPDATTLAYLYSKNMFRNLKTLNIEMKDVNQLFEPNNYSSKLIKLHFFNDSYSFRLYNEEYHLDNILEAHPLLKELIIKDSYVHLGVKKNYNSSKKLQIQELTLDVESLSNPTISFIRETMPDLKKLTIGSKVRFMKRISTLQEAVAVTEDEAESLFFGQPLLFPDHYLESVNLCSSEYSFYLITILCHVKTAIGERYYFYDEEQHKMIHYGTDLTGVKLDEDADNYYLQIKCRGLEHLNVNNNVIF